jgi:hypothetical protein
MAQNMLFMIMNPVSLLIFLVIMRYVKKEKTKKVENHLWVSYQAEELKDQQVRCKAAITIFSF